ncbi:MAG TPA: OsmC family protein [Gaiellaceae bacterium]|jgi:osmotically inducible protein OsmC|nr:OsmC family protein [Gaiellaceae bacterium]
MAIERRAHATWEGDLRSGTGKFDVGSGAISGQEVTFASRFTDESGGKTSPEELIAAAHATCFSMALANGLAQAGHPPTKLETDAVCTLDQTDAGFRITTMQLTVRGEVPGIGEEEFQNAARQAKEGCPVSNALGGVEISMKASLA